MSRNPGRHRAASTHHSTLRMRPISLRRRRLDGLLGLLAGTRPVW